MIGAIFDSATRALEKSMQLRAMRQSMLASNIANAETPNYRAIDIDFRATMENVLNRMEPEPQPASAFELERSDALHFSIDVFDPGQTPPQGIVFAAGDAASIGNDSNTVNMEEQLARLQMNSTMHALATRLYGQKIGGIKNILESTSRY